MSSISFNSKESKSHPLGVHNVLLEFHLKSWRTGLKSLHVPHFCWDKVKWVAWRQRHLAQGSSEGNSRQTVALPGQIYAFRLRSRESSMEKIWKDKKFYSFAILLLCLSARIQYVFRPAFKSIVCKSCKSVRIASVLASTLCGLAQIFFSRRAVKTN